MESKFYQEKICSEFEAMGLDCEAVDHFVWFDKHKEFDFVVTMNFEKFIRTSEIEYTEEKKKELKKFETYNEDKIKLLPATEKLEVDAEKMNFVVYYNESRDVLPGVYMRSVFFDSNFQPYNEGWISLLEKNGYKTEVEQSKLAGIFSKTEGEQVVNRAMDQLENQMKLIQEWINREIKIRVGKKIKLLDEI